MIRRRGHASAALLASSLTVIVGCTSSHGQPTSHSRPSQSAANPVQAQLTAFHGCADALAGLRKAAEASVGPYGLPDTVSASKDAAAAAGAGGAAVAPGTPVEAQAAGAAAAGSAAGTSGTSASPAFSGTNDYQAGVDEPDLVKTDGLRIVTVARGVLRVIDAASRTVTGRMNLATALGSPSANDISYQPVNLLLNGDHALLLISNASVTSGAPAPTDGAPQSAFGPLLLLVDLAGQPRVVSSYSIEGGLVDAREIGSVARVVISSQPRLYFPAQQGVAQPATAQQGTAQAGTAQAGTAQAGTAQAGAPGPAQPNAASSAKLVAANRAIIAHTGLDAWLPQFTETTGGVTITGHVPCTAVSRPATYSGAHLLTVLTFNLASDALGTGGGVTIAADGNIVYGTNSSLYVASDTRWQVMPATYGAAMVEVQHPRTYVYRFDVSQPGPPRFAAGGSVPGYLLDQYSLSEWNGYLRIATTTGTSWALADGAPAGAQTSSSAVYVLTTRGPVMRTAGQVTGLGISERIYAVRFMGPAGYVVTFRQTDPLYTLDLSDPAHPRVRGTLALTGYSAYLHPASAARLIGIGQQADNMGHIGGLQVSLFDVSDLASPTRLATYELAGASSDAQFDPHAFLYWPSSHIVVVPLQRYDVVPVSAPGTLPPAQSAPGPQAGALVLEINDTSIIEAGFITQPAGGSAGTAYGYASIERSLVIGQTLWTLSDAGLMASSMTTLKQQAWIPFT
jgi:hypothetical protein